MSGDNKYKFVGITDSGLGAIVDLRQHPINLDQIVDGNGQTIDKELLPHCLGHELTYYEERLFLNYNIVKLYKKPCNYNSRVKIEDTNLPVMEKYSGYLISNQFFSTPSSAVIFGLFESLVRNPANLALREKLLGVNQNLEGHYNQIFHYWNTPQCKEFVKKIESTYELGTLRITALQRISDDYNVGIDVTSAEDSGHYQLMPEFAEVNPIPLIKLLSFQKYLVLLYSSTQNTFDGFGEDGVLMRGVEQGEFYVDSFYTLKPGLEVEHTVQIVQIFSEIIEDFGVNENTKTEISLKINRAKEKIQLIKGIYKNNADDLEKACEKLHRQMIKIEAQKKAPVVSGIMVNDFPNPLLGDNKLVRINSPQPFFAPSHLENSRLSPINQAPVISDAISKSKSDENPIVVPPLRPPNKSVGFNQIPQYYSTPAVIQERQIVFGERGMVGYEKKEGINGKCGACYNERELYTYHKSCNMCEKCYLLSISTDKPKCILCNEAILKTDKEAFLGKYRLSCEACKSMVIAREIKQAQAICGHLLCESCSNYSTESKVCPACVAAE